MHKLISIKISDHLECEQIYPILSAQKKQWSIQLSNTSLKNNKYKLNYASQIPITLPQQQKKKSGEVRNTNHLQKL